MNKTKPRYSKEEFAKRGDALFEEVVRPNLKGKNEDDFVVIDIETGDFEIDSDELQACHRLRERHPDAQIWLRRVGSRYARHFGGRSKVDEQ